MNLNIGGLNSNIANPVAGKNGIVGGEEFELLTRELFSAASKTTSASTINSPKVDLSRLQKVDMGVNFFSQNVDANVVKQVAVNKTGFDVQLSTKAVSDIQLLKTEAAKAQMTQIDKKVEGKIVIPSEVNSSLNLKQIFSVNHNAQLNTGKLDKDRKGSNAFSYVPNRTSKKETESKESLSIFA